MTYDLQTYPDRDMLAMALANKLAGDLRTILTHEDRVVLAVPGGTSPGPVFDVLCAADLDWARVDVMLTDERWVPEDSAAEARMLPLYVPAHEPEEVLAELESQIAEELPLAVVLLGMGADMHTASIFPGADQLTAALAPDAPVLVPMRAPGAPEPRITLSARVLNEALRKHVLIFGEEKRAALDNAQGKLPEDAPINAVLSGATVHWAE